MFLKNLYMNEAVDPEMPGDAGSPPAEEEGGDVAGFSLRDLDEDTIYSRLQGAGEFPQRLQALESRLFGSMGPLTERLSGLEKSMGTRATVDVEALKDVDGYSEELGELLRKVLPKAIQANPLDETTLRPYLEPMQQQLRDYVGRTVVEMAFTPEELDAIVPDVKDGAFVPKGQLQEDFVSWYSQQGYATQQALLSLGPAYVHAMRKFQDWEKAKTQEREAKTADKAGRLAEGVQPSAQGRRRVATSKPQNEEEALLRGFEAVMNERKR